MATAPTDTVIMAMTARNVIRIASIARQIWYPFMSYV